MHLREPDKMRESIMASLPSYLDDLNAVAIAYLDEYDRSPIDRFEQWKHTKCGRHTIQMIGGENIAYVAFKAGAVWHPPSSEDSKGDCDG